MIAVWGMELPYSLIADRLFSGAGGLEAGWDSWKPLKKRFLLVSGLVCVGKVVFVLLLVERWEGVWQIGWDGLG